MSVDPSGAAPTAAVIQGQEPYRGKQGFEYTPGVSAQTVGSRGLWLGAMTVPPGARTRAHYHARHESALYMVSGEEVEFRWGERLECMQLVRPGDYVYIPAGLPHLAVNRTNTPAFVVAARTDPNEQESVELTPQLDPLVP